MALRTFFAAAAALVLVSAGVAGEFTSLHPEAAYPDTLPPLSSPGPYVDLIARVQQKLHQQGFDAGPIEARQPAARQWRALRGRLRRRGRAPAGTRGRAAQQAALRLHNASSLGSRPRLRQPDLRRLGRGPQHAGGYLRSAANAGDDG